MKRKIAEETRSVESKAAPKNLFELQVDDFLDDLVLSYDRRLATEAFAEKIQSWISSSGGLPSVELSNTKWMNIHRVSFPITLPFEIAISNIKIPQHCMWSQPASIKILESWHIGLATKHKPYLEMAVTMPKEFFGPRDFINFGYHVKRAQYACMIACVLVDYCKKMTWYVTDNRDLQPDLLVYESDHEDSPAVLLCFVPPAEFAPLSRFAPLTNNIRPSFLPEYKQTMVEGDFLQKTFESHQP
ncbi:hypothetical protein AB6A40_010322 [Gnathostoma spinigerum]|uniref:Nucleolar protein 6 n=1 Tax=Gnathostoma spinigerum TaxID=75299 RepID=A0ABD6EUX8_9BILA